VRRNADPAAPNAGRRARTGLARLATSGLEVFPRPLTAMFDSARTGFVVCIGEDKDSLVDGYHS
jgi:hypothetical protein